MAPCGSLLIVLLCLLGCSGVVRGGPWGPEPSVFGSHMVLASSDPWSGGVTPARIWGSASPGETLAVGGLPPNAVVSPSNPFTADGEGAWSITVAVPASLTPYTLVFKGSASSHDNVTLEDVLFGHTFLCSGQVSASGPRGTEAQSVVMRGPSPWCACGSGAPRCSCVGIVGWGPQWAVHAELYILSRFGCKPATCLQGEAHSHDSDR
jgi:hypothetical protein